MRESKKDKILHVRLTNQFFNDLFDHCNRHDENTSTFVREALEEKLEKEKEILNNGSNENQN